MRRATGILMAALGLCGVAPEVQAGVALVRSFEIGETPGVARPSDVAQRSRGGVWRVDDESLRALQLDAAGRLVSSIDLAALGARDPEGVALDPGATRLWVADGRARRVLELTPEGELLAQFELDPSLFEAAAGIAYDPASDHLFVVDDRRGLLAELTRSGEPVAVRDLSALGAVRPRGLRLGPGSEARDEAAATHLYVTDSAETGATRVLELAPVRRPDGALLITSLVGDVDGFGFGGDEPGFAEGDGDHDGLLEPGERIPVGTLWDRREPEDPPTTDRTWVVDERQPLAFLHVLALEGRQPLWARLTLVVADARAVPGRRTGVRVDGRRVGEVVPTSDGRIRAGAIAAGVLELPPASLRDLADGELRVELVRDAGTGSDDVMVDYTRLEVAVPR